MQAHRSSCALDEGGQGTFDAPPTPLPPPQPQPEPPQEPECQRRENYDHTEKSAGRFHRPPILGAIPQHCPRHEEQHAEPQRCFHPWTHSSPLRLLRGTSEERLSADQ
jgi:hypothetical protein